MPRTVRYRKEFARQALRLCRLGLDNGELAEFFGVSPDCLAKWAAAHPDFAESLDQGRALADALVGQRLFERATGYSHTEDKIFQYGGKPVVVPTVRHYPPEVSAMVFWLKNRRPDLWRDKADMDLKSDVGEAFRKALEAFNRDIEEARLSECVSNPAQVSKPSN